jgi:zinc transporter
LAAFRSDRAQTTLVTLTHIPDQARGMLLGVDNRQRLELFNLASAGVVADFERAGELDPRRMMCWRFWMAPYIFMSARRTPLHTNSKLHGELRSGRRFPHMLHYFDGAIHGFGDVLFAARHRMIRRLEEVKDRLLDQHDPGDFESQGSVRRQAVRLNRQVMPLQAMPHRLVENRPAWFTDAATEDCAQVGHREDSIVADSRALKERAHALQDELTSRQADLTNKRSVILSVLSAVLLPPTLIMGVFGMNVGGLPLKEDNSGGFVVVTATAVFLVVALR